MKGFGSQKKEVKQIGFSGLNQCQEREAEPDPQRVADLEIEILN